MTEAREEGYFGVMRFVEIGDGRGACRSYVQARCRDELPRFSFAEHTVRGLTLENRAGHQAVPNLPSPIYQHLTARISARVPEESDFDFDNQTFLLNSSH